jgi:hypothetical protein
METHAAASFWRLFLMKTLAAFLISALIALLLLAASILALDKVCAGAILAPAADAPPQIRVEKFYEEFPIRTAMLRTTDGNPARIVFAQAGGNASAFGILDLSAERRERLMRFVCEIRISDLVLLAGVVFLLLIGIFQGLWMRRAAKAAKTVAALADEALVSAQRPYVFLKDINISLTKNPINEEIQTCTLQPVWENTGATPTRNGRSQVNWKYFEGNVPEDFDFADVDDLGNRILSADAYRPLIVGPKSTAIAPVINLDPAILRQVRDLQGKLLVWGFAEYDEIFPGTPRHRTEFCYQVAVSGSPANHVGFSQYHRYNGVDGDCMFPATKTAG